MGRPSVLCRRVCSMLTGLAVLWLLLLQAEQYRGEADASQELLAFVLRSSPLRQQQQHGRRQAVVPPRQQWSRTSPAAASCRACLLRC